MANSLLETKLHALRVRSRLVPRPGLVDRLDAGLRRNRALVRKLALMSATADNGKTMLASCQILARGTATSVAVVSWLALSDGDSSPDASPGRFQPSPADAVTQPRLTKSPTRRTQAARPVIERRYPLEQTAEVHRYIDQGHKMRSVVITEGHSGET